MPAHLGGMGDDDRPPACFFGVYGCEQVRTDGERRRMCPKHCMEVVEEWSAPAGHTMWTADLAMLHARHHGVDPISEEGELVTDWGARADAADAAAASVRVGHLIFTKANIDASAHSLEYKHPSCKEDGDGRERLFGNGYMVAVLSAVVSFVTAHRMTSA